MYNTNICQMKERSAEVMREALADTFGILEYKTRNGVISSDDVRAILTAMEAGGGIRATVADLAGFYQRSEAEVRNVIHRRYLPKPVRRVTYDFGTFREAVPNSWRQKILKTNGLGER